MNLGLQNRIFAEAIANTATEALINVANLSESVLESDREVLESEVESIVQRAILNNIPGEALGETFSQMRRIRPPVRFVPKGKYQQLN